MRTVKGLARIRRLEWRVSPSQVLRAWPAERPLAALWSGGKGPRSRWTVLAEPVETVRGLAAADAVLAGTEGLCASSGGLHAGARGSGAPPFVGGWIGCISYEAGREIEPAARLDPDRRAYRPPHQWPVAVWQRCPSALVHDGETGAWWAVGEEADSQWQMANGKWETGEFKFEVSDLRFEISNLQSQMGRAGYEAAVRRAVEYIHAGDVFQVNLAHRLSAGFRGSARGLFAGMMEAARPWYGAYLEMSDVGCRISDVGRKAIVSASPELFLQVDAATRRVVTRPMKGTLRGDADPRMLRESGKDRAELAMITDLMRNDLGRVCEYGSVRVVEERAIEKHGNGKSQMANEQMRTGAEGVWQGVWQGVATVEGRLREGVGVGELVRAAFPGGSITGAPKIRAMQIVEELEREARGPYTGCIGYVSDCGNAAFNIAIRTAAITGRPGEGLDGIAEGVLDYGVGAGIVADSKPEMEWEETMAKAGAILGVQHGGHGEHGEERKSSKFKVQSSNEGGEPPVALRDLRVLRGESSGARR